MRDKLSNILKDGDCISEEMMLNYLAGKLSPQDQHRVEKHLLECELCNDAMEGLSASVVTGQDVADLKELDQKIEVLISRKEIKVLKSNWPYRIAAIVVMVALFGGALYYLKSVKKSEKIFTENFEPFRDTVHPLTPAYAMPTAENEPVKQEKIKTTTLSKEPEERLSAQDRKNIAPQNVTGVQETTTEKSVSTGVAMQSRSSAGAEIKKVDAATDIPEKDEKYAKPSVSDAESGNKKTEADESKAGDALSKNPQAVNALRREESYKNKSAVNDKQEEEAAPATKEFATSVTNHSGSAYNELIGEGIRQYEAKNYTAAISNLQQVLSNDAVNAGALFYSGVSNLSLDKDAVAIGQLESVVTNSPNKFTDAAKWYLSLAYVKKNKISKAKKLLKDLSLGKSEYKSVARKTLDELK